MGISRPALTFDRAAMAVLAVAALAVALTFRDYGISWDEPVQNTYGILSLNYYLSLGRDRSSFDFVNLFWYGALFDTLAAAANRILPFAEYDTRHLLGGLVGLAGLAATWRLGRTLSGPRAGFIAVLLLAVTPVWYGNGFINPKDIPFAAAMTWAAYFTVRIAKSLPAWRWSDFIGAGVASGAAMGTRVGGVIALLYLAAMLAMHGGLALLDREKIGDLVQRLIRLVPPMLGATASALGVMYLCWPWTQHAPIARPLEALANFSRFPITLDYPFYGRIVTSTSTPWYYEPGLMAAMLPELTLAALAVALVLALAGLAGAARTGWRRCLPLAVLALLVLFPPVYVAAGRAVLFDGMRHLLFVVPPLTVAAALAIDLLWRRGRIAGVIAMVLLGATAIHQATLLWRAHPYQYLVFNALVGGVPGAAGKFELDYWGTAFREAVEGMVAQLPPPAPGRPWRVMVCGPEASAQLFFPPGFEPVARQRVVEADFIISNTRYQCPRGAYQDAARPLVVVRRFDTPLAYVHDLRGHRSLTYSPYPPSP
jgi:hypothetical protein